MGPMRGGKDAEAVTTLLRGSGQGSMWISQGVMGRSSAQRWRTSEVIELVTQQLPEIGLSVNGHKLTAEVAYTDPTRTQGLMYRRMLPENRGMLFVFRDTAHAAA